MVNFLKSSWGSAKPLGTPGDAATSGRVGRFFKQLMPGKTKPQAPAAPKPKNQWAQAQADNFTAFKADQAYFKQAAQQNTQLLAKDIGAFRKAQKQPAAVSVSGLAKPAAQPKAATVGPQRVASGKLAAPPTGRYSDTGLSKDLQDRVDRLNGRVPGQSQAQELSEIQARLTALKAAPRVSPTLAKKYAVLDKLAKAPAQPLTPQRYQSEMKRLNALDQIGNTRQAILKDTKLSAAQRQKQLDGLRQIEKEYSWDTL